MPDTTAPSLEDFEQLVKNHDLTYGYSDDARVWRRGADAFAKLCSMAKQFKRADAVRIWNANIDRCLNDSDPQKKHWYWKE